MSYATQQDLVDRFGHAELSQLTDPDAGAVIDTTVVARALADADAEIDGYLATRYTLPLPSVPDVLVRVACDIARYRLWDVRASETLRDRYRDSVKLLAMLANGTTLLAGVATAAPAAGAVAVRVAAPPRVFGPGLLDQYNRTSGGKWG